MADPTFAPPKEPSPGTSSVIHLEVERVGFGDGYSQRGHKGINPDRKEVTLYWPALTHADTDAIIAFFVGLGGVSLFKYAAPPETTTRLWTSGDPVREETSPMTSTLTVDILEEFDRTI